MQQAPAWLSYASPVIALIALVFSVLTYRRAGPRVKVTAASTPRNWTLDEEGELLLTVVVRNTGLAPVQIVGLSFNFIYLIAELTPEDCYEGPDTPVTLQGGHQQKWIFDANQAILRGTVENLNFLKSILEKKGLSANVAFFRLLANLRFIYWVAAVADLGNGIQVRTRPILSLTLSMMRFAIAWNRAEKKDRKTSLSRQEEDGASGENAGGQELKSW